jgi:hypothetical protein
MFLDLLVLLVFAHYNSSVVQRGMTDFFTGRPISLPGKVVSFTNKYKLFYFILFLNRDVLFTCTFLRRFLEINIIICSKLCTLLEACRSVERDQIYMGKTEVQKRLIL